MQIENVRRRLNPFTLLAPERLGQSTSVEVDNLTLKGAAVVMRLCQEGLTVRGIRPGCGSGAKAVVVGATVRRR